MKKIIPFIILLISCQSSTEDKIKGSLKNIITKSVESKGQTIESMNIDSVTYYAASLVDYYRDKKIRLMEIYKNNFTVTEILEADSIVNIYDSLEKKADTTMNLFKVKFHLSLKTNKESFDNEREYFLYQNNLSIFEKK